MASIVLRCSKKAGLCLNRHSPAFFGAGGCELALCGSCKDARWRSHRVAARCSDPNDRNSTPRYTFAHSMSGVLFLVRRVREPALAGKARMPYKMNAQSFKHGCLKAAALSCHTMWQPKRLTRHGCETNRAFINVQRMHDSGRTESAQGRTDPNDRKRKDA